MNNIFIFTICCILVLLIVIFGSLAIITQSQANACYKNNNPWCYTDWKCIDQNDGVTEVNMSDKAVFGSGGVLKKCSPLTEEDLKEFIYTDEFGNRQVKYPGTEPNPWDPNCLGKTTASCSNYQLGDIYWPACNNTNVLSSYYVPPKEYEALHQVSLLKKFSP